MTIYKILTFFIVLSAAFAYINHRYVKMPFVIGLFFISTLVSIIVLTSKLWISEPYEVLKNVVQQTNISKFILNIMLGFLLFAGSLHTNWLNIKLFLKQISLFALGGVIVSTLIIAGMVFMLANIFAVDIDFIYCLLFGALISPTDPIAVLGILTKAGVSKKIETIIVGESLFNDGVGVVVFIALLEILESGQPSFSISRFAILFLREAVGGILFGLLFGWLLQRLIKSIDHYETEILLTIAFVMAGYQLCLYFHLSGALAMVVMGLLVGNYQKDNIMSDKTKEYVTKFWELVDVILNAILFILIAFVLVVIDFKAYYILIAAACVLIVFASRIIIVYLPKILLPKLTSINNREAKLLIWGGLRGGLSIAMVLSLPETETRNLLLIATYFVVVFSIMVQGLSVRKVASMLK